MREICLSGSGEGAVPSRPYLIPELSSVSNEQSEFRLRHFPTPKTARQAILSRTHHLWDYLLKNSKHCGIST